MTIIDALKRVINPSVLLSIVDIDEVHIKEPDVSSKMKKLCVTGISSDSIAFTLDFGSSSKGFCSPSLYFNSANSDGLNKSCDSVVATYSKGELHVLLLELKSDKPSVRRAEQQLYNSRLFVEYMLRVIDWLYGVNAIKVNYHSVVATSDLRNTQKTGSYLSTAGCGWSKTSFVYFPVSLERGVGRVHIGSLIGLAR